MERAIDGKPADAAVKDADGEIGISNFGFRIANWRRIADWRIQVPVPALDFKFAIRNSKSEIQNWWRRRELNSDPEANAEGIYMLSHFSFLSVRHDVERLKFRSAPSQ